MGSFQVLTTAGARMQQDQFPSTHATQIIELLASGAAGRSKVRSDVMARYRAALTIYARGSSLAHVMDADELVNTSAAKAPESSYGVLTTRNPARLSMTSGVKTL